MIFFILIRKQDVNYTSLVYLNLKEKKIDYFLGKGVRVQTEGKVRCKPRHQTISCVTP